MTNGPTQLDLRLIVFEDAYLDVAHHADGWDSERYQKCASALHLSRTDLQRLDVKSGAHVRVTAGEGTVVLEVKAENRCSEGTGWLPASLYSNFLSVYDPKLSVPAPRLLKVSISPTEEDLTPISQVFQRTGNA